MSKEYKQHLRNPAIELLKYKATHTFDPKCKCKGKGYYGVIKSGPKKGLYPPCKCAKKKVKI